jgi:hypothetical protein
LEVGRRKEKVKYRSQKIKGRKQKAKVRRQNAKNRSQKAERKIHNADGKKTEGESWRLGKVEKEKKFGDRNGSVMAYE